ncbi:GerAB/ArcD/ProY family transporter [Alicyclobacillus acidoterrestris]|uniref:GerAB/ArcD/ProY family transporter n=1 Tax=Alicyclobacillus acidoterrestris TaxID=1450 RepID=UPI003F53367B
MKNQEGKASVAGRELTALMILVVATNSFLIYPQYVSQSAYEAAWMEPIVSGALTLVLFYFVEWLMRKYYAQLDIVEVSKEVFGRVIAALLAMIFAAYFICTTAMVVREFTENVIMTVLPSTPILLVGAVFMGAVGYIAYAGLEGISRTAYIFLPILLIGLVGVCVATMNWWHPAMLLPCWGTGIPRVLTGSLEYSSVFSNVLLLTIIYKHAHNPRQMRRIGSVSITVSTLLLCLLIITYHMVFPAVESEQVSFALYRLARLIYLGPFFQRLESVFIFLWVTAATVKMAVTLWCSAYLLGKAFGWPTYRPGIPILALLSWSIAMWADSWVQVVDLDGRYLLRWGWTVVFVLPIVVLLMGVVGRAFKGSRGEPGERRRRRRGITHA